MKQAKRFRVAALFLLSLGFASCADKKAAGILYIKAFEAYEQKKFAEADAFINQSVNCDKKNKQAKILKAKIHLFQGQYKEAAKLFSDLYNSESDNKDFQRYLIQSLIFLEDYKRASQEIQKALGKDKGDWRLYYFASVIAAKENKVEDRFEALNLAQRALCEGADVFFDLAFCWESLGVIEKAKLYQEKCLCLNKSYANFFIQNKEEKSE